MSKKILDVKFFNEQSGNWGVRRPSYPNNSNTRGFGIASLNVWRSAESLDQRVAALSTVQVVTKSAFIALQEVSQAYYDALLQQDWLRSGYAITELYKGKDETGCVLAWKVEIPVAFAEAQSVNTGRPHVVLHLRSLHGGSFALVSAHLHPTESEQRFRQFAEIMSQTKTTDSVVVAGNAIDVASQSDFVDCNVANPQEGITWSPGENAFAVGGESSRIDTIIIRSKLLKCESSGTFGRNCPVPPSNHWGVVAIFSGGGNVSPTTTPQSTPQPLPQPKKAAQPSKDRKDTPPQNNVMAELAKQHEKLNLAKAAAAGKPTSPGFMDPAIVALNAPTRNELPGLKTAQAIGTRSPSLPQSDGKWNPARTAIVRGTLSAHCSPYDISAKCSTVASAIEALNSGALAWPMDYAVVFTPGQDHGILLASTLVANDVPSFEAYAETHPSPIVMMTLSAVPSSNVHSVFASADRKRTWTACHSTVLYMTTPKEMELNITEQVGLGRDNVSVAIAKLNTGEIQHNHDYSVVYSSERKGYVLLAALDVPCDIVSCHEYLRQREVA